MYPKFLLSLTPSILQRTFSTALYIHINHIPQLFSANYDISSTKVKTIPLNSRSVQVISNRSSTKTQTKTLNHSIQLSSSLAKHLGTIAEKQTSTYSTMTLTLSSQCIPKVDLGCKFLVTPTLYALMLQEPLPIMHLLENTV